MRKGGLILRLSTLPLVVFGLAVSNPASGSAAVAGSVGGSGAATYEALVKGDLGQSPSLAANGSNLLPTAAELTPPPPPPVAPPAPPAPPAPAAAPAHVVSVHTVSAPVAPATPPGYGCADALAYLTAHAAPGFRFECPGYALGHQAMTCLNEPGVCPGYGLIAISVPCAAAYMNEAHNSWVVLGDSTGIDPYGYCH